MDSSEQEENIRRMEALNQTERGSTFWNPTTNERRIKYANWLKKQINQQQKTLELDGVTHSRARKDQLRQARKAYTEEYKRIKDLIEDGGR